MGKVSEDKAPFEGYIYHYHTVVQRLTNKFRDLFEVSNAKCLLVNYIKTLNEPVLMGYLSFTVPSEKVQSYLVFVTESSSEKIEFQYEKEESYLGRTEIFFGFVSKDLSVVADLTRQNTYLLTCQDGQDSVVSMLVVAESLEQFMEMYKEYHAKKLALLKELEGQSGRDIMKEINNFINSNNNRPYDFEFYQHTYHAELDGKPTRAISIADNRWKVVKKAFHTDLPPSNTIYKVDSMRKQLEEKKRKKLKNVMEKFIKSLDNMTEEDWHNLGNAD